MDMRTTGIVAYVPWVGLLIALCNGKGGSGTENRNKGI